MIFYGIWLWGNWNIKNVNRISIRIHNSVEFVQSKCTYYEVSCLPDPILRKKRSLMCRDIVGTLLFYKFQNYWEKLFQLFSLTFTTLLSTPPRMTALVKPCALWWNARTLLLVDLPYRQGIELNSNLKCKVDAVDCTLALARNSLSLCAVFVE